jgi:hypothetical protein
MKYISISFLPGAAGNFFSRCLNILNGAHCFVDRNTRNMPDTPDEKLSVLGYESVTDKSFGQRDWIEFEKQAMPYSMIRDHFDLPPGAYSIWKGHPNHNYGCVNLDDLAGDDDQKFRFYIDPGTHVEWCCMNAFYKNSFLDVKWFIHGQDLIQDPMVHKIQLHNFLTDWTDFGKEITAVCNIIGHTPNLNELQAIETLYHQWKTTILDYKDMDAFKKRIGFT